MSEVPCWARSAQYAPLDRLSSEAAACSCAQCVGQGEPEGTAGARAALDADRAAVPLDDGAANVQAQTQPNARSVLLLGAFDAVEALPDARLILLGDTLTF